MKSCIEPTMRGYVCHTTSTDDILQYFTLSILTNCGHILQSLHFNFINLILIFLYNQYTNKILLSFPDLLELCLLFRDESIIPFINIASLKKLQRVYFRVDTLEFCENKLTQNSSLFNTFLNLLMNNCAQLSFLRIHITINPWQYFVSPSPFNQGFHEMFNNTNTQSNTPTNPNIIKLLNFFKILQKTTNNTVQKKAFTLKLRIDIEDYKLHITHDMAEYIKLILNDLYSSCKECILLLKLQFPHIRSVQNVQQNRKMYHQQQSVHQQLYDPITILYQFVCHDEQIKSQNWKIYTEMYVSSIQKKYKNCYVWAFVNSVNCSINGYSQKWNCDCCVCDDKIPWFGKRTIRNVINRMLICLSS